MEQSSSKLPFSEYGKQEKSEKMEPREETDQMQMQQTDTIQDQGNVVKGTRELEDGEELHRWGKVLLWKGNGKFSVSDIAALKGTE